MSGIIGFQPLLAIISHIFFIAVAFYALQAIMPEKIIKKNRVMQAQILFILLEYCHRMGRIKFLFRDILLVRKLPFMFG